MPPAKSSRNHDDSKSDAAHGKEKNGGHLTSTKMRRIASQNSASHTREVANAPTSAAAPAVPAETTAPNLQWSSFDRDALHAYRREHNLNTPTCFTSSFHDLVLSSPAGVGVHSPTMTRRMKARRQGKENLARTVRKHFNGVGIQENDVIVDFIHKVRSEKFAKSEGPNRQAIVTAQ